MSITSIYKVNRQKGFTLLEVMVALVIFSIGLLGLAGLQSESMSFNHNAYLRSQATILAYDILDKMRANPTAARAGTYNAAIGSTGADNGCFDSATTCTTAQMAQHDVYEWKNLISSILPSGQGSVASGGTPLIFTVTVNWVDASLSTDGSNPENTSVIVRSEI